MINCVCYAIPPHNILNNLHIKNVVCVNIKLTYKLLWVLLYGYTRRYNVQKTPWPVELNATWYENIKCNLTFKTFSSSHIFEWDLVHGYLRCSCVMKMSLIYILFLAPCWEHYNSLDRWDNLEDIGQDHAWPVEWLTFI